MSAPPYMRFYFGDYARDTGHLHGPAEHGAYFLLIKAMWNAGGKLPADDARLSRLVQCSAAEWDILKLVILPFFKRRGGVLRHSRIDAEMAVYENTLRNASRAGKTSASKRLNKNNGKASTGVERAFNQPEPEPEPEKGNKDIPLLIGGLKNERRPDLRRIATDNRRGAWAGAIAERNGSACDGDEAKLGGFELGGIGGEGDCAVTRPRKARANRAGD